MGRAQKRMEYSKLTFLKRKTHREVNRHQGKKMENGMSESGEMTNGSRLGLGGGGTGTTLLKGSSGQARQRGRAEQERGEDTKKELSKIGMYLRKSSLGKRKHKTGSNNEGRKSQETFRDSETNVWMRKMNQSTSDPKKPCTVGG